MNDEPGNDAVRRVVTGAVAAITGAVEAATGRFRALVGKSSGSIRALGPQVADIYRLAPDMIRAMNWSLDDDEVDDIVSGLVDEELEERPDSFVRDPAGRRKTVARVIRAYIEEKARVRGVRNRAYPKLAASLDEKHPWMLPASKLENDEADAAIRYAIHHMPAKRRAVYAAVTYGGLKQREVAERLGICVVTVEYHMGNANAMVTEVARAWIEGRRPVFTKMGRPPKRTPAGGMST